MLPSTQSPLEACRRPGSPAAEEEVVTGAGEHSGRHPLARGKSEGSHRQAQPVHGPPAPHAPMLVAPVAGAPAHTHPPAPACQEAEFRGLG